MELVQQHEKYTGEKVQTVADAQSHSKELNLLSNIEPYSHMTKGNSLGNSPSSAVAIL